MNELQVAISQIEAARAYTLRLLEDVHEEEWFKHPSEGVTHIAWQVGHLAFAAVRLGIERLRCRNCPDETILTDEFRTLFGIRSTPEANPAIYPRVAEIRHVYLSVHDQVLSEAAGYSLAELQEPPLEPHRLFDTKLGSLLWLSRHEMVHAGQIGLLRRLMGKPPQW